MPRNPLPHAYPLARPEGQNDPRFSYGLMFEVAALIEGRGYPKIDSASDLVRLQQALFHFIYGGADEVSDAA